MPIDYAKMRATADRLVSENGTPITFIREVRGAYDPALGESVSSQMNLQGNAVFTQYQQSEINNEVVLQGDKKIIFTGDLLKKGDYYTDSEGVNWRAENVQEINPNLSGSIIQKVQLRS